MTSHNEILVDDISFIIPCTMKFRVTSGSIIIMAASGHQGQDPDTDRAGSRRISVIY